MPSTGNLCAKNNRTGGSAMAMTRGRPARHSLMSGFVGAAGAIVSRLPDPACALQQAGTPAIEDHRKSGFTVNP
jgi:hypothetical protein